MGREFRESRERVRSEGNIRKRRDGGDRQRVRGERIKAAVRRRGGRLEVKQRGGQGENRGRGAGKRGQRKRRARE